MGLSILSVTSPLAPYGGGSPPAPQPGEGGIYWAPAYFAASYFAPSYFPGVLSPPVVLPGDFYEAFHEYLTETIDIAGGWHLGRLPTKAVYPAVSYWLIAGTEERIWSGGPIQRKRVQFTIFATNDTGLRLVMRQLAAAMRKIGMPDRLWFEGGNIARSDLVLDRFYLDETRENQVKPLWMGMLDYMFEVQFERE